MVHLYDPVLYCLLSEMKNKGIFRTYLPLLFLSSMLSRECWFGANSEDTFWLKKHTYLIFFYVFTGFAACSLLEIIKTMISVAFEIWKYLRSETVCEIESRLSLRKMILDWVDLDKTYFCVQLAEPFMASMQRSLSESSTTHAEETPAKQEEDQEDNLPKRELGSLLKFQRSTEENLQIRELGSLAERAMSETQFDQSDDFPKREFGPSLRSAIFNRASFGDQTVDESELFSF